MYNTHIATHAVISSNRQWRRPCTMWPSHDLRPTFMCVVLSSPIDCIQVYETEWQIEFRKSAFIPICCQCIFSSLSYHFLMRINVLYTFTHTHSSDRFFYCSFNSAWFDLFWGERKVNVSNTSFLPHNEAIYYRLNSCNGPPFAPQSIITRLQIPHLLLTILFLVYHYRQRLDGQILPNWRRWRCVSSNKSTHNINC